MVHPWEFANPNENVILPIQRYKKESPTSANRPANSCKLSGKQKLKRNSIYKVIKS